MKFTSIFLTVFFFFFSVTQTFSFKRQMEALDRGLVAVKVSNGVFLSWRVLGNEKETTFNVYRNGTLIKSVSAAEATNFTDTQGAATSKYVVKAVVNGIEEDQGSKEVTPWALQSQPYMTIQLNLPPGGTTPPSYFDNRNSSSREIIPYPDGENYTYVPNDCSVADLDGDGEYELIVKWDPTNSKDNSYSGMTGNVYLDAYKLDGTMLWRIDLGRNIRAGAHYTQFLAYDFDGCGKAEVICKTAPGTVDGQGKNVIMGSDNPQADYRNKSMDANNGYVLSGPEYLTIFNGETGAEINTIAYKPARGTVSSWGDSYGNRVDRFLACVAYLDGVHPSAVMCRGYYTRATLAAYDFMDGKLVERWFHDSPTSGVGAYGQGNHQLAVADVNGDGKDDIIYGAAVINSDGKLLSRTGLGHGDAMHVSDLDPDRPGLEVFSVHEETGSGRWNQEMHDPNTGEIIWHSSNYSTDDGRGMAADIDPRHKGFEMWSSSEQGYYDCKGNQISTSKPNSTNFRIYWDGDLQDELFDGQSNPSIRKWNYSNNSNTTLLTLSGTSTCNGSKATPCISADILGDWREEVITWVTNDPSQLRIYTTTTPTTYRLYTLMHDPVYRLAIAWQNVGYNQPPHLGFYIGDGLSDIPTPDMYMPGKDDPSGLYTPKLQETCNVYADAGGNICIESTGEIKEIAVYRMNGMLYLQKNGINSARYVIASHIADKMCIVKVTTNFGTEAVKVVKE